MERRQAWKRINAVLGKEVVSHASVAAFFNIFYAFTIVDACVMRTAEAGMSSPQAYVIVRDLGCAFAAVTSAIGFWTNQKWARHVGTAAWIVQLFAYGWFFALLAWMNRFPVAETVKRGCVLGESR